MADERDDPVPTEDPRQTGRERAERGGGAAPGCGAGLRQSPVTAGLPPMRRARRTTRRASPARPPATRRPPARGLLAAGRPQRSHRSRAAREHCSGQQSADLTERGGPTRTGGVASANAQGTCPSCHGGRNARLVRRTRLGRPQHPGQVDARRGRRPGRRGRERPRQHRRARRGAPTPTSPIRAGSPAMRAAAPSSSTARTT